MSLQPIRKRRPFDERSGIPSVDAIIAPDGPTWKDFKLPSIAPVINPAEIQRTDNLPLDSTSRVSPNLINTRLGDIEPNYTYSAPQPDIGWMNKEAIRPRTVSDANVNVNQTAINPAWAKSLEPVQTVDKVEPNPIGARPPSLFGIDASKLAPIEQRPPALDTSISALGDRVSLENRQAMGQAPKFVDAVKTIEPRGTDTLTGTVGTRDNPNPSEAEVRQSRLEDQLTKLFNLQNTKAVDANGRLKSTFLGALRGFLQGGLGGALAGGIYGGTHPQWDEELKQVAEIAKQQGILDQAVQIAKELGALDDRKLDRDYTRARITDLEGKPERERVKAEAKAQSDALKLSQSRVLRNLGLRKGQRLDPNNPTDAALLQDASDAHIHIDPDEWNNQASNETTLEMVDPENPTQTQRVVFNKVTGGKTVLGQASYVQPVHKDTGMTASQEGQLALGNQNVGLRSQSVDIARGNLQLRAEEGASNNATGTTSKGEASDRRSAQSLLNRARKLRTQAETERAKAKLAKPEDRPYFEGLANSHDREAEQAENDAKTYGNVVRKSGGVNLPVMGNVGGRYQMRPKGTQAAPSGGRVSRAKFIEKNPQFKGKSQSEIDSAIRGAGYEPY